MEQVISYAPFWRSQGDTTSAKGGQWPVYGQEWVSEAIKTVVTALVALALGWVLGTFRKASKEDVEKLERKMDDRLKAVEQTQYQQSLTLARSDTQLGEIRSTLRDIRRDLRDLRDVRKEIGDEDD